MYWNDRREDAFRHLSDYLACTANREQNAELYDAVRDILTALADCRLELAHVQRDKEDLEATVEELENSCWVDDEDQ